MGHFTKAWLGRAGRRCRARTNDSRRRRRLLAETLEPRRLLTADPADFDPVESSAPAPSLLTVETLNAKPVAKHDAFTTYRGETLDVPAPGYLANDAHVAGEGAATKLLSAPRFGALELNNDGSFRYEPYDGFSGHDSFRYQRVHAVGQSNPVAVHLDVVDPPAVLDLTAKPDVITVNTLSDLNQSDDGYTSLREALEQARANGPSRDIIELAVSTTGRVRVDSSFGPLIVDSDVEIRGPAELQEVVAVGQTNLFRIQAGSTATLSNLEIRGGQASSGDGGGIWNGGDLTVSNVHLTDNHAASDGRGGGIFNAAGSTLTVIESTFSGNSAGLDGGAIFSASGSHVTINTSTISSNDAGLWGGGVYSSGTTSIEASTIVENVASTGSNLASLDRTSASNSIVALGTGSPDVEGVVRSLGGNLVGDASASTGFSHALADQWGDTQSRLDPMIGPLQDNGGSTATHMLLPGSPAIDAGTAVHRFRDQRSADRVLDGLDPGELADEHAQVDVGAVEFGTFFAAALADAADATPLGDGRVDVDLSTPGDQVTLRGAIQELNALTGHGNTAGLGTGRFDGAVAFDQLDRHEFLLDRRGAAEDLAVTGNLDVHGNLSIRGQLSASGDPLTTISGGWRDGLRYIEEEGDLLDRLFHVHPGARLDVSSIKLRGGQADLDDGTSVAGYGGAILNEGATVFLADTSLSQNVAQRGGAVATLGGLTVADARSEIRGNYAGNGAAFYLDTGSLVVDHSTVKDNVFTIGGGAVYLNDGELLITNRSLVRSNTPYENEFSDPQGAALFLAGGVARVTDNTQLQHNGVFTVASNYESDHLTDAHLLPDPRHVKTDGALYNATAVVFAAESADFAIANSTIGDQDGPNAGRSTSAIINLGTVHSLDTTYHSNVLTLANFRTGTAIIEGGIMRQSGGHYDFTNVTPELTYDYATSHLTDSLIQNHNGELTLLNTVLSDNEVHAQAEEVSNYGVEAEMEVIGTTFHSARLFNRDGTVDVVDSFFADGSYQWYDNEPESIVRHAGHGELLTGVSAVAELTLAHDVATSSARVEVTDAAPLMPFQLPLELVIGDERLFVTDVDHSTSTLLVSRPAPRPHAQGDSAIIANEHVTQIKVDDAQALEIYDLPMDVYLTSSSDYTTDSRPSESRGDPGDVSAATSVEAMTVTDLDFDTGVLTVLRGRRGTVPVRFNDPAADIHLWSMPGQMTVSGTTFTNNSVQLASGDTARDSSQSLIRSSVAELAPPTIIENSTFSGNRTSGPVATVFAERTSLLGTIRSYHTQNEMVIWADGSDRARGASSASAFLPPLLAENTLFSASTDLRNGLPTADIAGLPPAQRYQNYVELQSSDTTNLHYVQDTTSTSSTATTSSTTSADPPGDTRLQVFLDDHLLDDLPAPSTTLADAFRDDGWLLHHDAAATEQAEVEWTYVGLPPGTYSVSSVFRAESEGVIPFRIGSTVGEVHVTTPLTEAIDANDSTLLLSADFPLSIGEHLRMGDEEMLVVGATALADQTVAYQVQRGAQGTDASSHAAGDRAVRSDLLHHDDYTKLTWVTLVDEYTQPDPPTDFQLAIGAQENSAVVADTIRIQERLPQTESSSSSNDTSASQTETTVDDSPASSDYFSLQHSYEAVQPTSQQINAETIQWKFLDVEPDSYTVVTNWDGTDDGRSKTAPQTGDETLVDDPLSERLFFDSLLQHWWFEFSTIQLESDELTVEVHRPADASDFTPTVSLIATDELRAILRSRYVKGGPDPPSIASSQSRHIIDNGQTGYATSSSTSSELATAAFGGSREPLPAGVTATWRFDDLAPGTYLVAASFDPENESTTPFTIRDHVSVLADGVLDYQPSDASGEIGSLSRSYDQRQVAPIVHPDGTGRRLGETAAEDVNQSLFSDTGYPPADRLGESDAWRGPHDGQHSWIVLDRVHFTGNELSVELAGGANVAADAIRIERFADVSAQLGAPADLGGGAGSQLPSAESPVIDHGTDSFFKSLDTELVKPVQGSYNDGLLFVDDLSGWIIDEHLLQAPRFPIPLQVGDEMMWALGYDRAQNALIVERGYRSTEPLAHAAGTKLSYGFAGRTTRLSELVSAADATEIRVESLLGLPDARQFDVRIGSEEMTVTKATDHSDGTMTFHVIRGVRGTTPEDQLPSGTPVHLLTDQSGGNRFFDGNDHGGRQMDFGAVEAVHIDVNTEADLLDNDAGDGYAATDTPDAISLRAAINEANALGGQSTVNLPAGKFNLSVPASERAHEFHGDLDIQSDITVVGAGADVTTIDAEGIDRVFDVYPGATLALEKLTVTGGQTDTDGGGIRVQGGTLYLNETAIVDNTGHHGAGVALSEGSTAWMYRTTVAENNAVADGGGVHARSAKIHLRDVTVSSNSATTGAGLFLDPKSQGSVASSTVVENSAEKVGGIHSLGTTTVSETVVAENTTAATGLPPDVDGRFDSGGHNFVGQNQQRRTQVYQVDGSPSSDRYSIVVTDPTSLPAAPFEFLVDQTELRVSKVDGNILHIDPASHDPGDTIPDEAASVRADGFWSPSDIAGSTSAPMDPRLGPLQINAGTTRTHEPLRDSPLIEVGLRPNGSIYRVDQRGETRYFDHDLDGAMRRDIGAVERAEWVEIVSQEDFKVESADGSSSSFTFLVRRSHDDAELQVRYDVFGSGSHPATPKDFLNDEFPAGDLVFAAGETEKTITVEVAGDDIVEADQQFTVKLDHARPGITIENREADGTIVNDDSARFTVLDVAIAEGDPGGASTEAIFQVKLDNAIEGGADVDYETDLASSAEAHATFTQDLSSQQGTLAFAGTVGETHEITITITNDDVVERDEKFLLRLASVDTSYPTLPLAIQTSNGRGTIVNDDVFGIQITDTSTYTTADGQTLTDARAVLTADVDEFVVADAVSGSTELPLFFDGNEGETFAFTIRGSGSISLQNVFAFGREASYDPQHQLDGATATDDGGTSTDSDSDDPYGGDDPAPPDHGGDYYGPGITDGDVNVIAWGRDMPFDTTLPYVPPRPLAYDEAWCDEDSPEEAAHLHATRFDRAKFAALQSTVGTMVKTTDDMIVQTASDEDLYLAEPFHALTGRANELWSEVLSLNYQLQYEACRYKIGDSTQPPDDGPDDPPPDDGTDPDPPDDSGALPGPFPYSTDSQWVSYEDQRFPVDEGFQTGIEVEQYEVSHNSSLTFNPIASYTIGDGVNLDAQSEIQLRVADETLAWGSSVSTEFGTVTANDDFTLTYTPRASVGSDLSPRKNPAGHVYRYDGLDQFRAAVTLDDGTVLIQTPVEIMVTDSLPVLTGDRLHTPDPETGRFYLDSPLYVDFETTARIDVNDLLVDPDGDEVFVHTINFPGNTAESGELMTTESGIISLPIGDIERATTHGPPPTFQSGVFSDTRGFANTATATTWQSIDQRHLHVQLVDPTVKIPGTDPDPPVYRKGTIVDLHNGLSFGDVNSSLASATRWNASPGANLLTLELVVTDGNRVDDAGNSIARVVQLDVVPRNGAGEQNWPSEKVQPTRPLEQQVVPTLAERAGSASQTDWKIDTVSIGAGRSYESVAGTPVDLVSGNFLVDHDMILDRSGGKSELALPGLVYDSSTVHVDGQQTPVVQTQITKPDGMAMPSTVEAALVWYDHVNNDNRQPETPLGREVVTTETFTLDWSDGTAVVALPVAEAPLVSGAYSWKLDLQFDDVTISNHGQTTVIVNQSVSSDDFLPGSSSKREHQAVFGAGWALAGVPTLTLDRYDGADLDPQPWNPAGFDDRLILSFPGEEPILFDYSELTVTAPGFATVLPNIQSGSKSSGLYRNGFADPQVYGTLTARHDARYPHPEPHDNGKADELVYRAPDGTEYIFYRFELQLDPSSSEKTPQYLLNRIEQPGLDFDPDVILPTDSTARRGASFERNTDATSPHYGRLQAIIASDGQRIVLHYGDGTTGKPADHVTEIERTSSGHKINLRYEVSTDASGASTFTLARIDHNNTAPDGSNLSAPQRVRQFDYQNQLMTGVQWLPEVSGAETVKRLFQYDRSGIEKQLGISGIQVGEKVAERDNQLDYTIIPAALAGLVDDPSQTDGIPLGDLTAKVVIAPSYEKLDANQQSQSLPGNQETHYQFDVDGHRATHEHRFGGQTLAQQSWQYDAVGNVRVATGIDGSITVYRHDYDIPAAYTDNDPAGGADPAWHFDPDDYRGNVTHRSGPAQTKIFQYETDDEELDALGRLVVATTYSAAAGSTTTRYERQRDGRITEARTKRGGGGAATNTAGNDAVETWSYYAGSGAANTGQLKSTTDTRGLTTTYDAYQHGRLHQSTTSDSTSYSWRTESEYSYDSLGFADTITSKINENVFSTENHLYDQTGLLLSSSLQDSTGATLAKETFQYNPGGTLIASAIPVEMAASGAEEDVWTEWIYDNAGLLTEQIDAARARYDLHYTGNSSSVEQRTTYSYYADAALKQTVVPGGFTTSEFYDPAAYTHWTVQDGLAGQGGNLDQQRVTATNRHPVGTTKQIVDHLTGVTVTTGAENRQHQTAVQPNVQFGGSHPLDVTETSRFDSYGRVVAAHDAADRSSTTRYDSLGLVSEIHSPLFGGITDQFETNAAGDVLEHTEHRRTPSDTGWAETTYTTEMEYDQFGRLRKVTDALAGSETGASPATIDYAFDAALDAVRVTRTSRTGVQTQEWYDAADRLIQSQNAAGGVTTHRYDKAGRLMTETFTPSEADVAVTITKYHYDQLGRVRNTLTRTEPNIEGELPAGTPVLETSQAVDYFEHGSSEGDGWNVIQYVTLAGDESVLPDHKHQAMRTRLDSAGNPVLVQAPDPGSETGDVPTTVYSYTYGPGQKTVETHLFPADNYSGDAVPTSVDASQDRKSKNVYSAAGDLVQSEHWDVMTDAFGNVTAPHWTVTKRHQYDQATGRLVSSYDAQSNETSYGYDEATGLRDEVIEPNGETIQYEFDTAGNRTRLHYSGHPAGGSGDTRWQYDALNRSVTQTVAGINDPATGAQALREWDYQGLTTVYTDRNGIPHTTVVSPTRGTTTTSAADGDLAYRREEDRNSDGSLASVSDSLDRAAASVYDSFYQFDGDSSDGQSTSVRGLTFGNDDLNHTTTTKIDGRGQADSRTLAFQRPNNQPTDLWTDDFDFDGLGRLTSVERTINDLASDVDSIWSGVDEPANKKIAYTYNADGARADVSRYDPTVSTTTPLARSDYGYTPGGRLEEIHHTTGSGGTLAEHTYGYGATGRLVTQQDQYGNGSLISRTVDRVFTYDTAGQLTDVEETIDGILQPARTYTGGRSSTSASWDIQNDNRLKADDHFTYHYDLEGRLTDRVAKDPDATVAKESYTWDPAGRLIEVVQEDSAGNLLQTIQYGYDADGLMSGRRTIDADDTVTSETGYLRQGLQILADLDLSGADPAITKLYLHGTEANEVLATDVLSGGEYQTAWGFTDALGTLTTVASQDSAGAWQVVHAVTHEYGGDRELLGDTDLAPLTATSIWAGHHIDPATGLVEAKARWYAPTTGRFLTQDPIGFAAGDANLYRYVSNSPTNAIDQSGLAGRKVGGVTFNHPGQHLIPVELIAERYAHFPEDTLKFLNSDHATVVQPTVNGRSLGHNRTWHGRTGYTGAVDAFLDDLEATYKAAKNLPVDKPIPPSMADDFSRKAIAGIKSQPKGTLIRTFNDAVEGGGIPEVRRQRDTWNANARKRQLFSRRPHDGFLKIRSQSADKAPINALIDRIRTGTRARITPGRAPLTRNTLPLEAGISVAAADAFATNLTMGTDVSAIGTSQSLAAYPENPLAWAIDLGGSGIIPLNNGMSAYSASVNAEQLDYLEFVLAVSAEGGHVTSSMKSRQYAAMESVMAFNLWFGMHDIAPDQRASFRRDAGGLNSYDRMDAEYLFRKYYQAR